MGAHGPLKISEVGSGAMEKKIDRQTSTIDNNLSLQQIVLPVAVA
jgi:hypothetical protein